MRAQIQAESSGNPNAVSRDAQGNPIAIGISQFTPATAAQFGIDPTNPVQSIDAQAKYMAQNLDQYGNVPDALRAYHGGPNTANWGPKGEAYVATIAKNMNQGQPAVAQDQSSSDPFLAMLQAPGPKGTPAPAPAPASASGDPFLDMLQAPASKPAIPDAGMTGKTPQQIEAAAPPSQTPVADGLARMGQGAMAIPNGIYQGFRAVTDTGLQGAARAVDAAAGTNYAAQADANAAKAKADFDAKYSGNDLTSRVAQGANIAGQTAAVSPVLGLKVIQAAGPVANLVNGAVQGAAAGTALSSQSDAPVAQQAAVGAGLGAAGNALIPLVAKPLAPVIEGVGGAVNGLKESSGYNALAQKLGIGGRPNTLPPVNATGPEMAAAREASAVRMADNDAAAKAAQATPEKPRFKLNTDGSATPIEPSPVTPVAPTPAPAIPAFQPPQSPAAGPAGAQQQAANKDTLKAIGLDSARPSAITGDKRVAGVEYQQAKLQTQQGEVLNDQLQKEQAALKNYGQTLVSDTGATATSPEQVGQAVRAPLSALSDYYDTKIGGLYNTADQRAAGAAVVQPNDFGKMLQTDSNFAGKDSNVALRRGINAYAKEQGIVGDDGSLQPMTVQKAEGLRQYINSQWSPENSGLIGKIKQSLDADVGTAGGADIYSQARALHAERSNTLDNPNGISSLLNESGPNGINKAVPDEKVASKILTMPTQQFQHVVATLKNLPDELQPQGQQALAEIKGALAKQIYSAGDNGGTQAGPSNWNAANVTRALNASRSKMAEVFSPDEIANFATLHDAGHILQAPSAYPGAAVQGHNLAQKGMLMGASASGGAALGHAIGGYPGMVAGAQLGAVAQNKLAQAFETSAANKLKASMQLR